MSKLIRTKDYITFMVLILVLSDLSAAPSTFEDPCPRLQVTKSGIGDYRDKSRSNLKHLGLVEGAHFTKSVRQLKGGNGGSVAAELNYVLGHFPNHHYALSLFSQHQLTPGYSNKVPMRPSYFWPQMECYFSRAIALAPNDASVYLIQAIHLHRKKLLDKAEASYLIAIELDPTFVEAHYNIGLLYMDKKNFETAKLHAEQAYTGGYQLLGLKNRLKKAGYTIN